MRNEFSNALIKNFENDQRHVFITGDLGYMALENVKQIFGEHFINGGISEQNIISMAAGMAYEGFIPWVYSISPFITLRPYEQIRNDVCHHNLSVKIVGNGGGYGYGIMGATHHNIEDIGAMRILPNMRVYVPFINTDVQECVDQMTNDPSPNYLRLNSSVELNFGIEPFKQWRKLKSGHKMVVIGTGPVLGNLFKLESDLLDQLEIWVLGIFPVIELPDELLAAIHRTKSLLTIEEHHGQCSMNESIASLLLKSGVERIHFAGLNANGYPSGKYGSQLWHQSENNLAGNGLKDQLIEMLKNAGK